MRTVCIDCRYLGSRPSGIGETVRALVEHVPTLAPDLGFVLLRHRDAPRLSDAGNVREVVLDAPANGPGTMWLLPRLLTRAGVDLSGIDLFHFPANILPAGLSIPAVTTVHDLMWLETPHWCNAGASGWGWGRVEAAFYRHGIRRALTRSAALVTVSAATGAAIARVDADAGKRVTVAHSGVATRFSPGLADMARLAMLGLDPARRFVLTVGQHAPYKNHEGALRGFAAAFGGEGGIDLALVQRRDAGGRRLDRLATELGIADRVRFLGPVDEGDLIALYRGAAALLHPSLCEGFGNPLAEAMACGCPVVASAVSAMPEVTGDAALLVDPRDPAAIATALRQVTDDEALAAGMRARGVGRARQLDWRTFAATNLGVYRSVLARS